MKFCPNCRTTFDDSVINCPQCGTPLMSVPNAAPENITDHTAEFDPTDISDNKVLAMIPYLLGVGSNNHPPCKRKIPICLLPC